MLFSLAGPASIVPVVPAVVVVVLVTSPPVPDDGAVAVAVLMFSALSVSLINPEVEDVSAVDKVVAVVASVFSVGNVLAADFLCLLALGGDRPTLSLALVAFGGFAGAVRFTGLPLTPGLPLLLLLLVLLVVIIVVVAAAATVEGLGDDNDEVVTLADDDVAVIGTARGGVVALADKLVAGFNAALELVEETVAVAVAVLAAVDGAAAVMPCSF